MPRIVKVIHTFYCHEDEADEATDGLREWSDASELYMWRVGSVVTKPKRLPNGARQFFKEMDEG